ncbi:MAG TPA: hypothetical protein VK689_05125 [Armatimonadota bacterium]|nr:hypothetical protein [Armatimonadota bacterium]
MDQKVYRAWLAGIAIAVCLVIGIMFITSAQRDTGPRTNLDAPQRGM